MSDDVYYFFKEARSFLTQTDFKITKTNRKIADINKNNLFFQIRV